MQGGQGDQQRYQEGDFSEGKNNIIQGRIQEVFISQGSPVFKTSCICRSFPVASLRRVASLLKQHQYHSLPIALNESIHGELLLSQPTQSKQDQKTLKQQQTVEKVISISFEGLCFSHLQRLSITVRLNNIEFISFLDAPSLIDISLFANCRSSELNSFAKSRFNKLEYLRVNILGLDSCSRLSRCQLNIQSPIQSINLYFQHCYMKTDQSASNLNNLMKMQITKLNILQTSAFVSFEHPPKRYHGGGSINRSVLQIFKKCPQLAK